MKKSLSIVFTVFIPIIIIFLVITGCKTETKFTSLEKALKQPNKVEKLDLYGKHLKTLTSDIGLFKNLKELNLSKNELKALPKNLANLTNLEVLNISSNDFTEIPEAIYHLKNLKFLRISSNKITVIDERIWQLSKLEEFSIGDNFINNLNIKNNNLTELNSFKCSNNQIYEIPNELFKSKKLKYLNFRNNFISKIPVGISALSNIIEIDVSMNKLTEIPKEIGMMRKITKLKLNNNRLTLLPDEVGNLDSLQYLDLSYNSLTNLPDGINKLIKLKEIHLDGNNNPNFKTVLSKLNQNTNFKVLFLRNNDFVTFPNELLQIKQLESISLNNNKLTKLSTDISALEKLVSIELENNEFDEIPPMLFNLKKIKKIELEYNPINKKIVDSIKKEHEGLSINFTSKKATSSGFQDEDSRSKKMPVEVSGVFPNLNPVGNSFGMMIKNISDGPVYFGYGTMIYFDDDGEFVGKYDVTFNKGALDMDAMAPLLKPGEKSEFRTFGPMKAIKGKLILKSFVGSGMRTISNPNYINELKKILGDKVYQEEVISDCMKDMKKLLDIFNESLKPEFYSKKSFSAIESMYQEWLDKNESISKTKGKDSEFKELYDSFKLSYPKALSNIITNLRKNILDRLNEDFKYTNTKFEIEGKEQDILAVNHHNYINIHYRNEFLSKNLEKYHLNKFFKDIRFLWDELPDSFAVINFKQR
jgi:Leucine-rich repeat (LRR) protein